MKLQIRKHVPLPPAHRTIHAWWEEAYLEVWRWASDESLTVHGDSAKKKMTKYQLHIYFSYFLHFFPLPVYFNALSLDYYTPPKRVMVYDGGGGAVGEIPLSDSLGAIKALWGVGEKEAHHFLREVGLEVLGRLGNDGA